ncbi:MAG: hypothetical protein ACYTF1_18610 [Planctomycetota bacterium]|jgi:hypothetical protein
MSWDEPQRGIIDDFRGWIESGVSNFLQTSDFDRHDREDGSSLLTRWPAGRHYWYEISLHPFLPQLRIGIMTDDRFRSQDLEHLISDSGDTLQEFVMQGFELAGLHWSYPPVEHYCEEGLRYYFSTPTDLRSIDQLNDEACRTKTLKILAGYRYAFFGTEG